MNFHKFKFSDAFFRLRKFVHAAVKSKHRSSGHLGHEYQTIYRRFSFVYIFRKKDWVELKRQSKQTGVWPGEKLFGVLMLFG